MPGNKPRKKTPLFQSTGGLFAHRLVARAAKADDAELNHHVTTIESYDADGEWS